MNILTLVQSWLPSHVQWLPVSWGGGGRGRGGGGWSGKVGGLGPSTFPQVSPVPNSFGPGRKILIVCIFLGGGHDQGSVYLYEIRRGSLLVKLLFTLLFRWPLTMQNMPVLKRLSSNIKNKWLEI